MKNLLLIVALITAFSGCESFLELDNPNNFVTTDFYKTTEDFEYAVNGVYQTLARADFYSISFWQIGDMRSDDTGPGDDLDYVSTVGGPIDQFTDDPNINVHANIYAVNYIGINRANTVIDRIGAADFEAGLKDRYLAEVKFLRALFYFNLVRIYGDVPLIEQEVTDLGQLLVERAPLSSIYEQVIISDLEFAEDNLPSTYTTEGNTGRATQWAAKALLAKVYLTLGEADTEYFRLARDKAKEIIDESPHQLEPNYADLFKLANENGQESIFEVQYITGTATGYYFEGFGQGANIPQRHGEGSMFNVFFSPRFQGKKNIGSESPFSLTGYGFNIPTYSNDPRDGFEGVPGGTGIVDLFTQDDTRKDASILDYRSVASELGLPVNPDISLYNVNKYIDWEETVNTEADDNFYILRLADVYLMFAEAENEVNNEPTSDAYFYVNEVRQRAFQDDKHNLPIGLNYEGFLDAVYKERRLELAFESHRWFDLIRRPERALDVMLAHGKSNITRERLLSPIPQVAIDQSNGRIKQNPGY